MKWSDNQEGCQPMSILGWAQGATTEMVIVMTGQGAPSSTTMNATVCSIRDDRRPMGDLPARVLEASLGHAHPMAATGVVPAWVLVTAYAAVAALDHHRVGTSSAPRIRPLQSLVKLLWGVG